MFGRKNKDAPVFDYQDWYTPFKCYECSLFFQTMIERDIHTKHQHPTEKENTMNTYTITVNGITEQPIQGTDANTIGGGLRILDGDQVVAAYNTWDNYRVERDVDKGYVDKISALENNLKDTWEVVSELEKVVTRFEAENERNNQEIGACDKEYLAFFSGGVQGKSPCIYRHGHNGAHKTANGDVWVEPNV